ncbi:MAG: M20 family metallopeptidase [Candidatus Promineifilaceae bacterium]|nr:M20 family metallopeptidase [Candidatus Promineifilaceae bacterium]
MPAEKETLVAALSEELIVDLTAELVAIPTPNPPGREKACAEFIFRTLQGWGVEVELVPEPDPERPQVVAWHRGDGEGPTLILNAHMDTVGAGEEAAWRYPPFHATRDGNRLYGRGTCDMKGSLAVGMAILKTLNDAGARFPGTLMLQAPMGEEMDEPGTRTLLQKGYTGDYAIVLEPTDLRIGPASRGVSWFDVVLTGPSVHCGLAAAGAPDVMAAFTEVAAGLREYHEALSARTHPISPSPGCRITHVAAGEAHNSLVGRCAFTVDRRMLPGETWHQVGEELEEIVRGVTAGMPEIDHSLTFVEWNEPVQAPLDSPVVDALQTNVAAVAGREPELWPVPYGCDVRNFIYDQGIPAVNFGAGDYRVCHQPNEFVPVDDLVTCGRVVMATVVDLLGGS